MLRRRPVLALFLFALSVPAASGEEDSSFVRYRVEQTIRLETTSARPQPVAGQLQAEPVTAVVEGRVRFLLAQKLDPDTPGQGKWHFAEVEVEGPRRDPIGAATRESAAALAAALAGMRQLEGREFNGPGAQLPVLPLGEASPAWLTAWLRWAQTGSFSGIEESPVELPGGKGSYEVNWLRSDFRQVPCHVQQASWTVPVQPAPGSLPPDLAAQGVEARTYFAAQSLEWVGRESPVLIYAERSAVRETFWELKNVERPELRQLVFRLRLVVELRVQRLP
ncbi:MAG: hypothetical protein V3R29_05480 [Candidatus Acidoferrales bacterium]